MQHSELGNILRVGRCFDIFRRQQMNNLDLHPGLTLLLGHICRNEGCSQEFLVEKVCLDKTTVAHHLARLEEKGYIERKISSQDARVRLVYPTEKARAIASNCLWPWLMFSRRRSAGFRSPGAAVRSFHGSGSSPLPF